jgi:hypothetical protein
MGQSTYVKQIKQNLISFFFKIKQNLISFFFKEFTNLNGFPTSEFHYYWQNQFPLEIPYS